MRSCLSIILFLFFTFENFSAQGQLISTIAGRRSLGGTYSGDGGSALNAGLFEPHNIAFDNLNNLYISDRGNHAIRKVGTNGIITTIAGTGISGYSGDNGYAVNAEIFHPEGIALDNSGNIYFSDNGNNVIRKISTSGIITTIAGTGIIGNTGNNGPASLANIHAPRGLDIDNAGNIYFVMPFENVIKKIHTNGIITNFGGNGGSDNTGDGGLAINASIGAPDGLYIDDMNNVYVSSGFFNQCIRKINSLGIISTFAGNGNAGNNGDGGLATSAELAFPKGMCFDNNGNFYIASQLSHVIKKVNIAGTISSFAGNGQAPCGYSGDGGFSNNAVLCFPNDVRTDNSGNMFIVDALNHVIRKVQICPDVSPIMGGDSTVCVGLSTQPFTNATSGGIWSVVSGSGTGSVTPNGIVTGITAGTITLNYTVVANTGCSVTTYTNVRVESPLLPVVAFPNPSSSDFTIRLQCNIQFPFSIRVIDAIGRVVQIRKNLSQSVIFLQGRNLSAGIYFIEIIQRNKKTVLKLAKQ